MYVLLLSTTHTLMGVGLCGTPGCKENHFYSLPFGQAEA